MPIKHLPLVPTFRDIHAAVKRLISKSNKVEAALSAKADKMVWADHTIAAQGEIITIQEAPYMNRIAFSSGVSACGIILDDSADDDEQDGDAVGQYSLVFPSLPPSPAIAVEYASGKPVGMVPLSGFPGGYLEINVTDGHALLTWHGSCPSAGGDSDYISIEEALEILLS